MTLPNFIGIGAQRAGTTWLHRMLSAHPEIFLPAQKELHFFDEQPDFSGYQGLGTPGQRPYHDPGSPGEWQWYRDQFKAGEKFKVRGEITPFYATLSARRVALMAERLPDLKIIYIIRDPVQRAWSGFRLFWFLETKHRECTLATETIRKTIMHPAKLAHGDYRRNTGVYEQSFAADKILYLFYDDLVHKPDEFSAQVLRFLGVDTLKALPTSSNNSINKAPEFPIPETIKKVLSDHYAGQRAFIKNKFGRVLVC